MDINAYNVHINVSTGEIVHMPITSAPIPSCCKDGNICVPSFPLFLTADVCEEENVFFFLKTLSSNLCLHGEIDLKSFSDFEVSSP